MTSSITAPDESRKASMQIAEAIYRNGGDVDHATARLIAAAMHRGDGSALQRFAGTGRFDVVELNREVRLLQLAPGQELWRGALLAYLRAARRKQPWMRGRTGNELRRLADDSTVWLHPDEEEQVP